MSVIAHLYLTVQSTGPGSQLHEEMCDEFPVRNILTVPGGAPKWTGPSTKLLTPSEHSCTSSFPPHLIKYL